MKTTTLLQLSYALLIPVIMSSCVGPKPVFNYQVDKKVIQYGDSIHLSWKGEKVNDKKAWVGIKDIADKLPVEGSISLAPEGNTKIQIYLRDRKNMLSKRYLKVSVVRPEIEYFTATSINSGQWLQLNWKVRNASSISIDDVKENLPSEGNLILTNASLENYTLRVRDQFTEITQTTTFNKIELRRYLQGKKAIDSIGRSPIRFEIFEVDNRNFPSNVKIKVYATDTLGNFISNLAPPSLPADSSHKYFKTLVEKFGDKRQKVNFKVREIRETNTESSDIVLTLDYSGSMAGVIDSLEVASKILINGKNKSDRMAVVKFDDKFDKECGLLMTPDDIIEKADFTGLNGWGGATALYAACDESIQTIEKSNRNKYIILFTDGNENSSFSYFMTHTVNVNALAYKLRKNKIKLICIAFGEGINENLLRNLSIVSNGSCYLINHPQEISMVMNEINYLMKNYYEISYRTLNNKSDRTIELIYNNNLNEFLTTERDYIVSDRVNLTADEYDSTMYWSNQSLNITVPGMTPVGVPQVAINFDHNQAEIESQYLLNLNNFANYLIQNSNTKAILFGHTDKSGKEEYNNKLALQRAEQVKDYLIKKGISEKRIITQSLGEQKPVWPTETEKWQARENRRVEIVFYQ